MKINNAIQVVIATLVSLLLTATVQAGNWRNNGAEQTIGGLKTFVYQPTSSPMLNGKRALMVSLHGCSQPNDDFKTGAGWQPVADAYGMVIALPQAAGEGSYGWIGCWNFHTGMNSSRTKSDQKYLVDMVNALIMDGTLNIDPKQVYITGLSSGAGISNQMGCLAPDVFAGVGVNAGPAPGSTGSTSDLNNPSISVSQGESNCKTLSNKDGFNNQADLYTQLWNTVQGTNDSSVSPQHAHRNADIAVAVYNDTASISQCRTGSIAGTSASTNGDLTVWCDADGERISKILVNGMGHAWPAGNNSAGGGNYIDHTHINYPEWITNWFFSNNRRIGATPPPPPPVGENSLVLTGAESLSLANCEAYQEPGYTATDAVDGDISSSVVVSGSNFDSCSAGNYVVNYSVTFSDSSSAVRSRAVNVAAGQVPNTCQEYTSSTYAHSTASRAWVAFGLAYAIGSNDALGLWNLFNTKTLAETSPGYFEVGSCPN